MKRALTDRPAVQIALVLLLALLAYSDTLDTPYHFDDRPNIEGNAHIRDISNIPSLLAGRGGIFASRAVMHATFAVNYYFGALDTTGYHAVNIALHLINGVLLYLLVSMTGGHLGFDDKKVRAVAVMSCALFVLHPVQTEAVTNIVNRSMLLSAACYLSGTILFLRAVNSKTRRWPYMAGLLVVSLAGMGSRENFAMFPVVLVLYDLLFISGFRPKELLKHYWAYIPVILSLGYMAHLVLNNTYARRAEIAGIAPADYALTQLSVHWTYLRLMFFPFNQNLDYDYPAAKSIGELRTIAALAGYLALWWAGVAKACRRPEISFPVLWFLITLLPISFMVALTGLKLDDVIFEHRLYLPGAGVLVLVSAVLVYAAGVIKNRWRVAGKALAPALVVVLVAFAAVTHARNAVWESDISLWEDVVKKSPGKARPHNDLGIAYKNAGDIEGAIEQGQLAIRIDPSYATSYINLGNCYYSLGMPDKAIDYYRTALLFRPYYTEAYYNLGVAYQSEGLTLRAMRYYERAIELNPYYVDAHLNLGIAHMEKGSYGMAEKEFRRVLELKPGDPRALENLRRLESLK